MPTVSSATDANVAFDAPDGLLKAMALLNRSAHVSINGSGTSLLLAADERGRESGEAGRQAGRGCGASDYTTKG